MPASCSRPGDERPPVAGGGRPHRTHAATWGAFKDSRSRASAPRASRAASCSACWCPSRWVCSPVWRRTRTACWSWSGSATRSERLATEWWKSIPPRGPRRTATRSRCAWRLGGPRRSITVAARYGVGLAIAAGLVAGCCVDRRRCRTPARACPPLDCLVLVGGIGGWLTAVGGAWKDAPIEGFSGWKFLRSPVVATAWAVILLPFTQDLVLLAVAAGGARWPPIETYKTFLAGGPPGKFAAKPVRPRRAAAYGGHVAACTPGCTRCSQASSPSTSCRARHLRRD